MVNMEYRAPRSAIVEMIARVATIDYTYEKDRRHALDTCVLDKLRFSLARVWVSFVNTLSRLNRERTILI